jgi:hypothetical protein
MGITWDEILLTIIVVIGIILYVWKKTEYDIKYTAEEDMKKPFWWI